MTEAKVLQMVTRTVLQYVPKDLLINIKAMSNWTDDPTVASWRCDECDEKKEGIALFNIQHRKLYKAW